MGKRAMDNDFNSIHLDAARAQAFLEGDLAAGELAAIREHLGTCARCRMELEAWSTLMSELDGLPELQPSREFAERVLSKAPLRHLAPDQIQDFVEGSLPTSLAARVEEHLSVCGDCRDETQAWAVLFRKLDTLPEYAPSVEFAEQVVQKIDTARQPGLLGRITRALRPARGIPEPAVPGHVSPDRLQDFVEGVLPRPVMARVKSHLDDCSSCREEAAAWQELMTTLDAIPELAPTAEFADTVMARVRPQPAHVPALPMAARVRKMAGRLVPATSQGWATAAALAMAPTAALATLSFYLFSQPQVTPASLLTFLWWKGSEWAGTLAESAWGAVTGVPLVGQLWSALSSVALSPASVALGVLAFSVLTMTAVWVLYRNLLLTPVESRNYATATI